MIDYTATETASYVLTSDGYISHGGFGVEQTTVQWANRFRRLGGKSANVYASHQCGTDGPVLVATGTPESLAYVEQTLAA